MDFQHGSDLKRATLAAFLALCCSVAVHGQFDWPRMKYVPVVSGAIRPTHLANAGDGSGRLFVVEQPGRIRIVESNDFRPDPFLDITDRVLFDQGERGLFSVAFPPDFAQHGWFYVDYSRKPDGAIVVSRFRVSTDANVAGVASEQIILTNTHRAEYHYGGQLAFGPDGFLYVSCGDDYYGGNAPQLNTLLGKLLRIDVAGATNGYRIPGDNPFAGQPDALPEIWAYGLRNPWRFSFDRLTGDLFIGDVGEYTREEIDFQPVGSAGGQNYGWPSWEGTYQSEAWPPDEPPANLVYPVVDYGRLLGRSVIGGFVYRGPSQPRLDGMYLYGDFASRRLWGLRRHGTNWLTEEIEPRTLSITTFGEDEAGSLHVATIGGGILRLEDGGELAPPRFDPPGWDPGVDAIQDAHTDVIRVISRATNAIIRYTMDGRVPEETDPVLPESGTVTITNGTVLQARAWRDGSQPSEVTSNWFPSLRVASPMFTPAAGPITNGTVVTITCATPGAEIRFTLDGSYPQPTSALYTGPLVINAYTRLQARAFRAGLSESWVEDVYYTLQPVAFPRFSPANGPITNGTAITITCSTPGAVMRYSTNYGEYITTNSPLYTGPITLNGNTWLRAVGFRDDLAPSYLIEVFFDHVRAATPEFTPSQGPITNGTLVSISCATTGAVIRYSLDGSIPTTNSPVYAAPLALNGNTVLKAVAFKEDLDPSFTQWQHYEWERCGVPHFDPSDNACTNGTLVTIRSTTPGAIIHYTLDFTTPDSEFSIYSGPIRLNFTTADDFVCIRTISFAPGYDQSPVGSLCYYWSRLAAPYFWPPPPITNGTEILIQSWGEGVTIRYTLDGSEPDGDSAIYVPPLRVNANTTLKARSFQEGYQPSGSQSLYYSGILYSPSIVTTLAGTNESGFEDGVGGAARFFQPFGICLDVSGNLFVADFGNSAIRKVSPGAVVTTLVSESMPKPRDLCADREGNLYVTGSDFVLRRVDSNGVVSVFAGDGTEGHQDGPVESARFSGWLNHVAIDPANRILLTDDDRLRIVSTDRNVTTTGILDLPFPGAGWTGLDLDADGNLWAVQYMSIRRIAPDGTETHIAGKGYFGIVDGPPDVAEFHFPEDIAVDRLGNAYVISLGCVRKIDPQGFVTTLAGNIFSFQAYRDGTGAEALFLQPSGLCVDTNGTVYVADTGNHVIRKITQLDWDNDGIPDAEEGGPRPFAVGVDDRQVDTDGDGQSNAAEYLTGTNPLDPSSALVIRSSLPGPNGAFLIQWQSLAGKCYQVQSSDDLIQWRNRGGARTGDGGVLFFTNPPSIVPAPRRFYRLTICAP